MTLSQEQEEKMYAASIKSEESIRWMRERLEKGDDRLDNCDKRMDKSGERLSCLEIEWKILKGKLGLFVLILSAIFTAALHVIGWFVAHFWK